jgi:hypothetical protein
MDVETQFMWMMLIILGMGIVFYSLGYSTGKKDGYKHGRSMGIRIGERRALDRRVSK